jgi:hypothetical protein
MLGERGEVMAQVAPTPDLGQPLLFVDDVTRRGD